MAEAKQPRRPKKPRPTAERRVIEDPALRAETSQHARLKAEFDAVHAGAMNSLKKRDFQTFKKAIEREREIIRKQSDVIRRIPKAAKKLRKY